ncbi:MAG TPA: O-antigen ligase family protein [Usitatibacteraceae bacterium]
MKLAGPFAFRLLIIAICAYIALAAAGALRWYMYSPSHDEQRAVQLLLVWAVGAIFLGKLLAGRAPAGLAWCNQYRRQILALGIFFGIGLVSASRAMLPAWALLEWSHLLLLAVLCIALSIAIERTAGAQEWLFVALVAAAVFYMLQVLVLYFAAVFVMHAADNNVVVVGFSHRRFAAQMQAMLIPMLGALYFQYDARRVRLVRVALLLLAGFAWMLCFVAAARGAGVALLASVLALAILGRVAWLRWMKFYAASLLIGVVLVVLLFVLLPDWLGATMSWENRLASTAASPGLADSPGRLFLWAKALAMVRDSPLLGIGPMHFAYQFHNEGAHPHNLVLLLMAEWGPLAMLCFVGVLLGAYVRFGKFAFDGARLSQANTKMQLTTEGLWAVLTIIAVYSLIDGLFVMPYSQILIVFFTAWAMALYRTGASAKVAPSKAIALRISLVLVLLIALASIAVTGFPAIGKSREREEIYERSTKLDFLFPRFWAQGWIGPLSPPDACNPVYFRAAPSDCRGRPLDKYAR